MTTKTYYAKLDCRSNNANIDATINEEYYNLMSFLTYLSSSNLCTLISWNSGSAGAGTGAFSTKTYWDGGNPFGIGAHSIWRFNTSSTRNWEWYMYVQVVSGTNSFNQTHNLPVTHSFQSSTSVVNVYNGNGRCILLQAAVCVSGSSSFNPWNGTISQGNSTAASPRWVSGALNRNLYVLPRSNDFGGVHVTQKASCHTFGRGTYSIGLNLNSRQHFFYDGDAIMCMHDRDLANAYDITYVGAFELRNELTSSGIGGGPYGFCMLSHANGVDIDTDTISAGLTYGLTDGTVSSFSPPFIGGGIAVPIRDSISGSKSFVVNGLGTFPGSTYQPNTVNNKFEEYPIYIGGAEAPYVGLLGTLNTGLVRYMRDVQVNDTTADFSRAVFGGTTTVSNLKISTPWTGSSPPGTSTSRTGSNYTWTTDYR